MEIVGEDEQEKCNDKECDTKHLHMKEFSNNQFRKEMREAIKK